MNQSLAEHSDSDDSKDQYLVFPMGEDSYGLNIGCIREIIEYCDLTEVPMVPEFIRGVLNLRGRVVPVIDLNCRFSGKVSEIGKRSCILIVELHDDNGSIEMGMLVDAVTEVIDIDSRHIEPPPSFGAKIRTDFIEGMGKVEDRFIVLLRIDRVLSIDELSMIQQVHEDIDQAIRDCADDTDA